MPAISAAPTQPRHPVLQTAGSVPATSTSVTVLGLLLVTHTMVPVAQAVTRTGSNLPVNTVRHVRKKIKLFKIDDCDIKVSLN